MAQSLNDSIIYSHFMPAILAGGGTGGHVIPALALAHEPQTRYVAEGLFIGTAVHVEETAEYFRRAEVTGVPVRQAFFEIPAKRGGIPTLLVFGGSQGAHAINQAMIRCLPELRRQAPAIRIIHQTGERDYND